jgi:ribosomal protein L10
MSKLVKQIELDTLRAEFKGVKDFVLLEPIKVDSATEFEFRKKLRGSKVKVKLVKNSYTRKIFGEMGINGGDFSGPTVLCYGGESVKGLANAVDTAVKESKKDPKAPEKFKVRTAIADGEKISLDIAKTLPTRLEAIGDVLGALLGAGSSLASCLVGPGSQIASILTTIEEKKDAAPAA